MQKAAIICEDEIKNTRMKQRTWKRDPPTLPNKHEAKIQTSLEKL